MPDMTRAEADGCWNRIYAHGESMKAELVDLYQRRGWIALGCKNWHEMMQIKAPGKCRATYYNLLSDAFVAHGILESGDVQPELSTILETLPHDQYSVLKSLPDPIARRTAIQLAYATAPELLLSGKPTAALMQEAVNVVQEIIDTKGTVELDDGIHAATAKVILNHHERIQNHVDAAIVRKSKQNGGRKDEPTTVVKTAHAHIISVSPILKQVTLEFDLDEDTQKVFQCYHQRQGNRLLVSIIRNASKIVCAVST